MKYLNPKLYGLALLKLLVRRTGIKAFSPLMNLISFWSNRIFNLKIVRVEWLDEFAGAERILLRPSATGFAYGPVENAFRPAKQQIRIPEVCCYAFRDVMVTGNSSSFLTGEKIIIERLQSTTGTPVNYNAGHLIFRRDRCAIVQLKAAETLEKGFFLGGNGSFNYYHWLTELLPKIEFLNKVTVDFPLLVPEEVNKYPSFKEALLLLAPGRELIYLSAGKHYAVKHLVNVTTASNLPFNVDNGLKFKVADFLTSFASLKYLRNSMLKHIPALQTSPKRIFLKRDNSRRAYNQDEIEEVSLKYGFVSVQCENLSFLEQVQLFSNAEIIIGPTGAAWSNLVFASKGCKALCWMAEAYNTFSSFSTLAAFAEVDLKYAYYWSGAESTGELYHAGYRVDTEIINTYLSGLSLIYHMN